MRPPLVVYIDDDAGDLELFRIAVGRLVPRAEVVTFDDAAAALAFCRQSEARPELIVVDVNMPGEGGFRFLAEARRLPMLDGTPIVFLSASDDPDLMLDARESGADGYFLKPVGFARYTRVIRNLLSVPRRRAAAAKFRLT